MTICMGYVTQGRVLLCTDQLIIHGDGSKSLGPVKVKVVGPWGFAYSGDPTMARIVEHALENSQAHARENGGAPACPHEICTEIRRLATDDYGWPPTSDQSGGPPYWDFSALLTDGYTLWMIGAGVRATRVAKWETIGSGASHATGAAVALEALHCPEIRVLEGAVSAAIESHRACGGVPITYSIPALGGLQLAERKL